LDLKGLRNYGPTVHVICGLQANVAKLDSAIAIYADKLELRVGGFSDKLLKLVSRLFKELR
jgi:hypothetical protein